MNSTLCIILYFLIKKPLVKKKKEATYQALSVGKGQCDIF